MHDFWHTAFGKRQQNVQQFHFTQIDFQKRSMTDENKPTRQNVHLVVCGGSNASTGKISVVRWVSVKIWV